MNPPRFQVPAKWGLCFAGNEEAFCSAIDLAIDSTNSRPFRYVEIGLGFGDGMRAVQFYVAQHSIPAQFVGVDIPTCNPSAASPDRYMLVSLTTIHLDGAKEFAKHNNDPIHMAFIDGCHGANCAKADFIGIEPYMCPGGIVIFHDTDQGCQGLHWQEHCNSGIEVRKALVGLGLIPDGRRHPWKLILETTGDKTQAGHGMSIFQKT